MSILVQFEKERIVCVLKESKVNIIWYFLSEYQLPESPAHDPF